MEEEQVLIIFSYVISSWFGITWEHQTSAFERTTNTEFDEGTMNLDHKFEGTDRLSNKFQTCIKQGASTMTAQGRDNNFEGDRTDSSIISRFWSMLSLLFDLWNFKVSTREQLLISKQLSAYVQLSLYAAPLLEMIINNNSNFWDCSYYFCWLWIYLFQSL